MRAIEAQSQPIWRILWAQCLDQQEALVPDSAEVVDENEACGSHRPATADAAVIVAGFVVSVPYPAMAKAAATAAAIFADSTSKADAPSGPPEARGYLCVSLGSGSRCLGVRDAASDTLEGQLQRVFELRDGHAEVMARRGLLAFLIDLAEAGARCSDEEQSVHPPFLQRVNANEQASHWPTLEATTCGWTLQDGVQVHLVCSRWMCGSLAAVAGGAGRSGHLLIRAGCGCWASKLLEDMEGQSEEKRCDACTDMQASKPSALVHVRNHVIAAHYSSLDNAVAYAHCARVKPGRGRPNLTMSCTDKVWRWAVLGLQGRRRAVLFPIPMRLSSVHVLRSPKSPSSSVVGCAEGAAAKARKLFQWRTQSWWPTLAGATVARVTPEFYLFAAPLQTEAAASLTSSSPFVAGGSRGDSSYSRCRWLTVHGTPATASPVGLRKREREDSEGKGSASARTAIRFDWGACDSSNSRCSLVLNTKAGLPQGMTSCVPKTARSMPRQDESVGATGWVTPPTLSHTAELMLRRFPLSRPWMEHRVERARAATNPATTTTLPSPSSSSLLDSLIPLPMRQLAHQQHMKAEGVGDEAVLFLWTAAGCV
ncbi:Adenosine deaminase-like protein [Leptomonas seymouri]|uniref:tRNA-specific adenosine deaminase 1 n=1 Tax=Leptomonas seymouri TaxID=5684 RepID=A0A0N0P680_LEPSE|nr:Adenosine deaminase-like protein [Leptomonas seymouri]|eukprot:KPI86857.1 Adenosine deaminase-like protein [Leptomonas seymouri]